VKTLIIINVMNIRTNDLGCSSSCHRLYRGPIRHHVDVERPLNGRPMCVQVWRPRQYARCTATIESCEYQAIRPLSDFDRPDEETCRAASGDGVVPPQQHQERDSEPTDIDMYNIIMFSFVYFYVYEHHDRRPAPLFSNRNHYHIVLCPQCSSLFCRQRGILFVDL
jgi:hypothetical protein